MKTNSTFKLFRNLLLLVVGVMGFAVSGFAADINISSQTDFDNAVIGALDNVYIKENITINRNITCANLYVDGYQKVCTINSGVVVTAGNVELKSQNQEKITGSGSLVVTGNLRISSYQGKIDVSSLNVTGNVTLSGQDCTIDADFNCTNLTMESQNTKVTGNVTATGTVTMKGSGAEIEGNLSCASLTMEQQNTKVTGNVTASGAVTMKGDGAEIKGNINCASLTMQNQNTKVTGNVDATGSITMSGASSNITGNVTSGSNITLSGQSSNISGNVDADGDVTLSGQSCNISNGEVSVLGNLILQNQSISISAVKFKGSGSHSISGWTNSYSQPTITTVKYCDGGSYPTYDSRYITISNAPTPYSCGASVSGTPVITTSSAIYCTDAKPTFSVTTNVTYSGAAAGYPKYRWYNASTNAVVATTNGTSWNAMTAAGSYYMRVLVAESPNEVLSDASNTVTISAPVGNPTITADNSVSFENTVGCTPLDVQSVSATLGNVCSGSISHSITGPNADKFEFSTTPSHSGKVYSYSVRLKENTTPGTYTATLRLTSGGTTKNITLSGSVPAPSLSVDKSSVSLMNENGAAKKTETITVTKINTCETVTAVSSNPSVFSVTGDGTTFTITYEDNEYDDETPANNSASGTITFMAGSATATVTAEGSISSCSASEIVRVNFEDGNLPSIISDIVGTANVAVWANSDPDKHGYIIKQGEYLGNSTNNPSSKALQLRSSSFKIKYSEANATDYYEVSLLAGNNYQYADNETITVGSVSKTIAKNGAAQTFTLNVSGSTLKSGISVSHNQEYAYFDDIVITRLCPPDVKVSVTNECVAGTMGFSAAASAISGSSISSYQWYKNGVAISGATTSTYTPSGSELFPSGTKITVKVTDDLGLSTTSKPYTYSCGPIISDITAPATICAGGALSVSAPSSVTSASAISEQGWEYCDTEDGVYTPIADFSSFKSAVAAGYKNYYLRYYAINNKAKSTSNAVQITMFDAPTIGSVTAPSAVCDGSALADLSVPAVDAKGASITSQGWEISNGGGWSSFNPSTTLTQSGYDGKNIRYFVQNQCSDRTNSSTVPLVVNYPTVELADIPNRNAAVGYVATVATPSLTTNECAGSVTYSLSVSGTDASNFSFNTSTGEVRTTEGLPIGEYTLTITATENGKNVSDSKTFKVTVVAESPIIMDCSGGSYDDFSQCAIIPAADYNVTSRNLTENVQLSLEGTLADYFSLSRSEIPMNTENQAVRFTQTKTLPIGTNSVKISAKSDGVEFASCLWTFTVPSPFTGSITTPVLESTGTNPKCPYEGTGTLSATASLDISSTCEGGYPKYGWFKNGELVGSLTSSYSSLDLGTIDGADAGSYTLRVFSGENAYFESPAYVVAYPIQLSIVGGETEFYCADKVSLIATDGLSMYSWFNGSSRERITSNNTSEIQLSCGNNGDYLMVEGKDATGCFYTASVPITIRSLTKYYYCGPTGNDSELNNYLNWCTVENGNTGSCTHPSENFDVPGCEYVINKDDVILQNDAERTWNVSGNGTKITLGNGLWQSFSVPESVTMEGASATGWDVNRYGLYKLGSSIKSDTRIEFLNQVADVDLRSATKSLTINGTINLGDGVSIDVLSGSELVIASSTGNPTLGYLERDHLDNSNVEYNKAGITDGALNGDWAHLAMIPGSIVTYKDAGATKIQPATYSNVFINTSGDVVFPEGTVEVVQQLKYDKTPNSYTTTGSTVLYSGSVNQTIAAMPYNNLDLENATHKTLGGNVTVNGSLTVGSGATLDGGSDMGSPNTLTITSSGDAVSFNGKFNAGTSTVAFTSAESTNVPAMPYYNLSLGNGPRILSSMGTTGIAGSLTSSSSNVTVTGSTVEFNGTSEQTVSAFTFNNLRINNRAGVTMNGDVTVNHQLVLGDGILTTNANQLHVTNPSSSAVSGGSATSYVEGALTWNMPSHSDGSDLSTIYLFPVGVSGQGYYPLSLSALTTDDNPEVSVLLKTGWVSMDGVDKILNGLYWGVAGNGDYNSGSVSLKNPDDFNVVVYYETEDGTPQSKGGSNVDGTMLRATAAGSGFYSLAKIAVTANTYYYDCLHGGEITNPASWFTEEGGEGTPAVRFTEDYTTWILNCDAEITGDLSITGSDVKLQVGNSATMTVEGNLTLSALQLTNNTNVVVSGKLTVLNSFLTGSNAVLTNNGEVDFSAPSVSLNYGATIQNNEDAVMKFNGTDLMIYDSQDKRDGASADIGHFINKGAVTMTNASFYMQGISAQFKNESGASFIVNNSGNPSKKVTFSEVDFVKDSEERYISLECGSGFYVKGSDVTLHYYTADGGTGEIGIGGDLIVEDGNLEIKRYAQGGGNFKIDQNCGTMIVTDTDNTGDGLLKLIGTGGSALDVSGTLYAMGIITSTEQAGNHLNVNNGGFAFIGNLGATMSTNSWEYDIKVHTGGKLYYCGNRTANGDHVGVNGGYMCYASSYYNGGSDDPEHQGDFVNSGTLRACFESMEACQDAFNGGVEGIILPVELTMLYGVCVEENQVELRWQTASETNCSYFAILRSFDGVHFEEIGTVAGAGTTTEFHNYEYYDTDEKEGVVYYKLRQTDFDGNTTESKVIAVQTCGKNAHFKIKQDEIEVFFRNPQANYVVITSVTGQIFYSKKFTNVEEARIAVPQRKGIYIISVIDSKQITSEKFIR